MQLAPAMAAPQQARQETLATADRGHCGVAAVMDYVASNHGEVLLVGLPGNIALVVVWNKDSAIFGGA